MSQGSSPKQAWSQAQETVAAEAEPPKAPSVSQKVSRNAAQLIVARPCVMMSLCCGVIAVIVGVTMPFFALSDEGPKDWSILSGEHTRYQDAIVLAERETDCLEAPDPCPVAAERGYGNSMLLGMSLLYEAPGDIFTPEHLQTICEVERLFWGHAKYAEACWLKPGAAKRVRDNQTGAAGFQLSDCMPPQMSVVYMFYSAAKRDWLACELISASEVENVSRALYEGLEDPSTFTASGIFVGNDVISGSSYNGKRTVRTRSVLSLGYPLYGRDDKASNLNDPVVSNLYREVFYEDFEKSLFDLLGLEGSFFRSAYWDVWQHRDIRIWASSQTGNEIEVLRTVDFDLLFAIASVLFVWGYLTFHTKSLFIGTVSIVQIVISIVLGYALYNFIFRVTYYRQLHALLIFIILGIGADDVFVFSDAWYQSSVILEGLSTRGEDPEADPEAKGEKAAKAESQLVELRLAFAYEHAMVAVANTTFTTGMAFVATCTSPLMPIRSMGIYALTLVLINYILVITLTPCTFAVCHMYEVTFAGCRRRCGRGPTVTNCREVDASLSYQSPDESPEKSNLRQAVVSPSELLIQSRKSAPALVTKILIPLFRHRITSVILVVVLAVWGIVNLALAAQLESPVEPFTFFGDGHMFADFQAKNKQDFASGADNEYNVMTVVFGVDSVDRDAEPGVDQWKPHKFYGEPVYDHSFDLSTKESQQFLLTFCERLRNVPCGAQGCQPQGMLIVPSDNNASTSCFIEEFDKWNGGVRYEGQQFIDKLKEFRNNTRPTNVLAMRTDWSKSLGFVNGELKFVQVAAKMTLLRLQGNRIKAPVLEELTEFLDSEKRRAPPGMKSILQTVPFDWILVETNRGLIRGLFTGFAIGFPVAFAVLLVATRNIIVALVAIITVIFIVGNVLGYCKMAGWYLGAGECIAGIIVIGLAVDYTIHLGHAYLHGAHQGLETRGDRWEFAMNTMGVTVIAGAVTTLFASLVMQFCQISFFNQMSTLMVLTISYSITYTISFFMAALKVFGPERKVADIPTMLSWCRGKLQRHS